MKLHKQRLWWRELRCLVFHRKEHFQVHWHFDGHIERLCRLCDF